MTSDKFVSGLKRGSLEVASGCSKESIEGEKLKFAVNKHLFENSAVPNSLYTSQIILLSSPSTLFKLFIINFASFF